MIFTTSSTTIKTVFSQNLTTVEYAESLFWFTLMQLWNTCQNQKGIDYIFFFKNQLVLAYTWILAFTTRWTSRRLREFCPFQSFGSCRMLRFFNTSSFSFPVLVPKSQLHCKHLKNRKHEVYHKLLQNSHDLLDPLTQNNGSFSDAEIENRVIKAFLTYHCHLQFLNTLDIGKISLISGLRIAQRL